MAADAPHGRDGGTYVVVARRYRPQGFGELVGQGQVSQALGNAINSQRVGHAYLFTGARGVGKTSTARIFAKALNCERGPTPAPCNTCDICQSIAAGEDVDVLEIDGASNRGIDEIRQLRSNVGVRPSRSRFRIYIIDEVHMLTGAAFNALLKTLEEPPEHVKFIFCTTDPEKIPITVLSRCQRFDFAPVEPAAIQQRLREIVDAEGAQADDDALALLARRAAGSMRDSQSLLEQLLAFASGPITVEQVHAMLGTAKSELIESLLSHIERRDAAGVLAALDAAVTAGVDAGQLAEQLLGWLRDLLVAAVGGASTLLQHLPSQDHAANVARARAIGVQTLLAMLQIVDQALVRMRQSTQSRTLLEIALVRLCQLESLDELDHWVTVLRQGVPPLPPGALPAPANAPAAPLAVATSPPPAEPAPAPAQPTSAPAKPVAAQKKTPDVSPSASEPSRQPLADSPPPSAEDPAATTSHQPPANSQQPPLTSHQPWLELTPATAGEVWRQALGQLEELTAQLARLASSAAISAPNELAVTFPARYNLQKESCERPDRRQKIERALREVTGRDVRLDFRLAADDKTGGPVRRPAPPASRSHLKREAEKDPLIAKAAKLFDAEVVLVQPLPSSGETDSSQET